MTLINKEFFLRLIQNRLYYCWGRCRHLLHTDNWKCTSLPVLEHFRYTLSPALDLIFQTVIQIKNISSWIPMDTAKTKGIFLKKIFISSVIYSTYFICSRSDFIVPEDAWIEPGIAATLALAVRHSSHSARSRSPWLRMSTEVRFWLPTEYGIFSKTYGIPRYFLQ
jgi:hypothetical protein